VVPQADAAAEAGRLIENLSRLWEEANMQERRKLLLTMLDAVYFDTREWKSIVAIKPKPSFMPILKITATREGSDVLLIKEPPGECQEAQTTPCFWWRRGGVDWKQFAQNAEGTLAQRADPSTQHWMSADLRMLMAGPHLPSAPAE